MLSDLPATESTARPNDPRGSAAARGHDGTAAPKHRIPLDLARLRPHLRPPGTVTTPMTQVIEHTTPSNRIITPSPGELRGIPVVGHGGAIPGTNPGANL